MKGKKFLFRKKPLLTTRTKTWAKSRKWQAAVLLKNILNKKFKYYYYDLYLNSKK